MLTKDLQTMDTKTLTTKKRFPEIYKETIFSKKIENLCIPTNKGFQVIKLDDIICCEANNTYTIIFLDGNKQIISTRPLVDYELILSGTGFSRIHKSWLINLKHLKEYIRGEGGRVILSNNKSVDVSRRKKENFISELKRTFIC